MGKCCTLWLRLRSGTDWYFWIFIIHHHQSEIYIITIKQTVAVIAHGQDKDYDLCIGSTYDSASQVMKDSESFYPLNDIPGVEEYLWIVLHNTITFCLKVTEHCKNIVFRRCYIDWILK